MNKTVTANISGIVFHIEVDAYEKLNTYLDRIRGYFKNSDEREEIMADIEARIAEIFNEKISDSNQVIRLKDVEQVIEIMGKPEDYVQDEGEEEFNSSAANAGEHRTRKRLFRDPDDRILGGVCSGVGHYVGLDPIWIRLLFIIVFLAGGSGILIYIILWIIMPEAKTPAQKLQMKGEPVNIESIGKAFEEGTRKVNESIKNMDSASFGQKLEDFFESVFHVLGVLLKGIFRFLGKFIGVILIIIGSFIAITFVFGMLGSDALVYAVSSDGLFSIESSEFILTIFNSEWQYHIAKISLLLLIGIPVLGLIYGGVKLLFKIKGDTGIGTIMGVLWLIGLGMGIFSAVKLGYEFKSDSTIADVQTLNSKYTEYVLELNESDIPGIELISSSDDDFILNVDKANIYFGIPTLDIQRSYGDSVQLKITRNSQGSSKRNSLENAQRINYHFNQNGELITFDPYISFAKEDKIRGQEVELTLLIPLNTVIYLDESMEEMIYDIDNVTNTYDGDMLGRKWIMLEDGLTCLDCPDIEGVRSDELREKGIVAENENSGSLVDYLRSGIQKFRSMFVSDDDRPDRERDRGLVLLPWPLSHP